jgi:HEAT repeat protein
MVLRQLLARKALHSMHVSLHVILVPLSRFVTGPCHYMADVQMRRIAASLCLLAIAPLAVAMIQAGVPTLRAEGDGEISIGGKTRSAWIASLEDDIGDKKESRRGMACEALGLLGPAAVGAVPGLMKAASDRDPYLRRAATKALGQIGSESEAAIPLLVSHLLEEKRGWDAYVDETKTALARIGHPAVPHLVKLLDQGVRLQRIRAAETLGEMGHDAESAVSALTDKIQGSQDDYAFFRALVLSLGRIGPAAKPAVQILTKILSDKFLENSSNKLDEVITQALTRMGEPPVAFLIQQLSSEEKARRVSASEMLGVIGPDARDSASKLSELLTDKKLETDARTAIAAALGEIDPLCRLVVPMLVSAAPDDARRAIPALRRLGPFAITALPELTKLVDDSDPETQSEAIKALYYIDPNGAKVVPTLIHALRASDPRVRAHAAYGLGRLGPLARESVPWLVKELGRDEPGDQSEEIYDIADIITVALGRIHSNPEVAVPRLASILNDARKSSLHRNALIAICRYGASAIGALPSLVKALRGNQGALAAEAIGHIGPDARAALPELRTALNDKRVEIRGAAALAIFRIDPPASTELWKILESIHDLNTRARVLAGLGRVSPEGLGLARLSLRSLDSMWDSNTDKAPEGIGALEYNISRLGDLGPSAAVAIPKLALLLRHRDPFVARASRAALAQIERTTSP